MSVRRFDSLETFMDSCTDSLIHESKYGRFYKDLDMILKNHSWIPAQIHGFLHRFTYSGTDSRILAQIHGSLNRFTDFCTDLWIHESKYGRVYEDS